MASVYEKGGYLYLSYYKDGERHRESLGLKANRENRKIAKEMKLEKERKLTLPGVVVKKNLTTEEAIKQFERHGVDSSANTKRSYSVVYDYFKTFFSAKRKVNTIVKDDILDFQSYLSSITSKVSKDKLSQNSIASYFRTLSAFFNFLIKNGFYDKDNPVPRLKTVERPIVVIPENHFDIILAYLKGRNITQYRVIKMLELTGRRVSEVLSLRWENVDFDNELITFHNTKANRQEIIPIHESLGDFLKTFKKESGKLFKYSSPDSLNFWRRGLDKCNLPAYPLHSIRKTFVTKLVSNDVPIFDASKIAGHSNIRTTIEFYAKVDVQKLNSQLNRIFKKKGDK